MKCNTHYLLHQLRINLISLPEPRINALVILTKRFLFDLHPKMFLVI
jgi:hypothetical protein